MKLTIEIDIKAEGMSEESIRHNLIEHLEDYLERDKFKVYTIDSSHHPVINTYQIKDIK